MFQYPLGLLRLTSLLDGVSWVILSYISFYQNKFLGNDLDVSLPGRIHGGIFTVFMLFLVLTMVKRKWPLHRAALVFVCSLIPFAPFFLEPNLKREQESGEARSEP